MTTLPQQLQRASRPALNFTCEAPVSSSLCAVPGVISLYSHKGMFLEAAVSSKHDVILRGCYEEKWWEMSDYGLRRVVLVEPLLGVSVWSTQTSQQVNLSCREAPTITFLTDALPREECGVLNWRRTSDVSEMLSDKSSSCHRCRCR